MRIGPSIGLPRRNDIRPRPCPSLDTQWRGPTIPFSRPPTPDKDRLHSWRFARYHLLSFFFLHDSPSFPHDSPPFLHNLSPPFTKTSRHCPRERALQNQMCHFTSWFFLSYDFLFSFWTRWIEETEEKEETEEQKERQEPGPPRTDCHRIPERVP